MRITCHNISFAYPESSKKTLNEISCELTRPGFHSIFGPSGVGKSTFARLIGNTENNPFKGHIEREGISTTLYSYNLERLPGWASAGSHLDRVVSHDKSALKKQLISIFGLARLLDSRFHQLSMGQQNRINLIRYLLQDFDMLIMDESLANVDEKLRQSIILAIKKLFPDRIFLYISHHLMEVATFCDEIIVMGNRSTAGCIKVIGQNCRDEATIDKAGRDQTMLEIMNAF